MAASCSVFHENCGSGILLSNGRRRAARNHPNAEFDHGLVFSKSILPEKTIFEVVIEKKTTLWSGSLAIGVTLNDPGTISEIPANISCLRNGTWVLAGTSILNDGLPTSEDYLGNLEELTVGDKVGVMRMTNAELHFFINGKDMGCAAKDIPSNVYVVVDIYGRCCQVKLCNDDSLEDSGIHCDEEISYNNGLCFHPHSGFLVKLSNNRKTVFRPNPDEGFNNGIALTERPLAIEEILEIEILEIIEKWAGSLEIGVTTHAPGSFQLPATMTNVTSGTWILSGCAIVQNGCTVREPYGDLTPYKVGDKLGVCIKSDNTLHFYYNGVDLGCAASDLPSPLYAVVDLYGQAVKATIMNNSSSNQETLQATAQIVTMNPVAGGTENQQASTNKNQLRFSEIHGRLITLNEDRTGAFRINALTEFNHAVVTSEHPLEDDCLFEIEIEKTTNRWSGSLEVGLLSLAPPDLELPITLTDLNHHTWVLSGRSVMQDGNTIVNGYGIDLDSLEVGARVGIMRKSDGTFHVFINGEDKGTAATAVPPGTFAAIDLYGQCVQVAIVTGDQAPAGLSSSRTPSAESLTELELSYSFHSCGGENIAFRNHGHTAVRTRSFNGGLVFSNKPLQDDDIFEIRIDKIDQKWTGSFCIGVTSTQPPLAQVPTQISDLKNNTVCMCGSFIFKDGEKIRGYGVSLDRLQEGSRVGIRRHYDSSLHIYIDSQHKGIAATNIPQGVFGVVDVYGSTQCVSIVNTTNRILWARDVSSDEETVPNQPLKPGSAIPELSFHSKCGLNIIMDVSFTTARRKVGFNDGLVFSHKPLGSKEMFQVRVDSLNPSWSGSLAVGIIGVHSLEKLNLPATALSFRLNSCTLVHGSEIYINGVKTEFHYECNFDELHEGDRVGVICDNDSRVHIIVNDVDQGFIDHEIPGVKYAMFDLYGRCEQISVVLSNKIPKLRTVNKRTEDKKQERNEEKQSVKDQDFSCEHCDFKQRCEKFQITLGIPAQYFTKTIICYCVNCCDARGESGDAVSGDPPQEFRRPLGWCKFELRIPPNFNFAQVLPRYHVAYIGVHVGAIRRTLDRGAVLPARKNNRVISGDSDKKILMSPSICHATTLSNEKSFLFTDITSGKRWSTQVAFELRLPSDSYTTISSPNSKTQLDKIEWCVDLSKNVVLTGLLVYISEEDR